MQFVLFYRVPSFAASPALPRNLLDICRAVMIPRPILFSRGPFCVQFIFPRSFLRTILFSRGLYHVIFYRSPLSLYLFQVLPYFSDNFDFCTQ
jgi:hypothetical protein